MSRKLTIEMTCDNSAFGDTPEERDAEICRILAELPLQIECNGLHVAQKIFDINGIHFEGFYQGVKVTGIRLTEVKKLYPEGFKPGADYLIWMAKNKITTRHVMTGKLQAAKVIE